MYRLVFTKDNDPDTKFQWRDPFDDLPDVILDQAIAEFPADQGYTPAIEELTASGDTSDWVEKPVDPPVDPAPDQPVND